jgi:hypothetical protein
MSFSSSWPIQLAVQKCVALVGKHDWRTGGRESPAMHARSTTANGSGGPECGSVRAISPPKDQGRSSKRCYSHGIPPDNGDSPASQTQPSHDCAEGHYRSSRHLNSGLSLCAGHSYDRIDSGQDWRRESSGKGSDVHMEKSLQLTPYQRRKLSGGVRMEKP